MRRTLATAALAGGLVLGGAGVLATPALASPDAAILAVDDTDGTTDNEDDAGKWGLAGLAGMLGLFGYKKYKASRATGGPRVGGVDSDGSGSRRV